MKNVGVPFTPLRTPLMKSSRTRPRARRALMSLIEARQVQPELLGEAVQVFVVQRPLVLVQQVVHLPELALGGGRLRRLGGALGMRVRGG